MASEARRPEGPEMGSETLPDTDNATWIAVQQRREFREDFAHSAVGGECLEAFRSFNWALTNFDGESD